MQDSIRNFMAIYIPGIKEYWSEPYLKFYFELEYGTKGDKVIFFCIHHVTNVINDEWELKSDDIFIWWDSKIYLIKSIDTNYETEVEFDQSGHRFRFNEQDLNIRFSLKNNRNGFSFYCKDFVIPRSDWKPIELLLEVISPPEEIAIEEIRQSLVGEKFPINVNSISHPISYRKDDSIFIASSEVIKTLTTSQKLKAVKYFSAQKEDYVLFKEGCFKLR